MDLFGPCDRVQEPNEEGRGAGAKLMWQTAGQAGGPAFIYVNNRFEGNAPRTISAMLVAAGAIG